MDKGVSACKYHLRSPSQLPHSCPRSAAAAAAAAHPLQPVNISTCYPTSHSRPLALTARFPSPRRFCPQVRRGRLPCWRDSDLWRWNVPCASYLLMLLVMGGYFSCSLMFGGLCFGKTRLVSCWRGGCAWGDEGWMGGCNDVGDDDVDDVDLLFRVKQMEDVEERRYLMEKPGETI